jgi:hypothetical protein
MSLSSADPMSREPMKLIQEGLREAGYSFDRIHQEAGESLLLVMERADCVVELMPDGRLACQFGVDMEELRTLVSGDSNEDIAEDELQRVAREHLRPRFQKFRPRLTAHGFEETVDTTAQYYAISFVKPLDLSDPPRVVSQLEDCLKLLV